MVMLTIADLAMIMPLATWYLIDSRVAEKEKLLNNICSRSPGDHDCGQLFLQFVVIRKLLDEN